jgi:hypothetical protein
MTDTSFALVVSGVHQHVLRGEIEGVASLVK